MTPQSEFVPIGKPYSSTQQLELNFMDQQQFIYEMQETGKELESSPLALPFYNEVQLGRIALLDLNGERSRRDQLSVQFAETNDGRRNATIDFLEGNDHTRFKLANANDQWQVFQAGSKEATQIISNEQVVSTLYPKLRNKEALSPLMDSVTYDSIMIPRMLASHLEKNSHRTQKKILYRAPTHMVQGLTSAQSGGDTAFITSIGNEFSIFQNNGRSIHTVKTSAPYELGSTTVVKEYTYKAETSAKQFYTSEGSLTVSSSDGYNAAQLADFAKLDQYSNDPLFSLHRGLSAVRSHHGLDKDVA